MDPLLKHSSNSIKGHEVHDQRKTEQKQSESLQSKPAEKAVDETAKVVFNRYGNQAKQIIKRQESIGASAIKLDQKEDEVYQKEDEVYQKEDEVVEKKIEAKEKEEALKEEVGEINQERPRIFYTSANEAIRFVDSFRIQKGAVGRGQTLRLGDLNGSIRSKEAEILAFTKLLKDLKVLDVGQVNPAQIKRLVKELLDKQAMHENSGNNQGLNWSDQNPTQSGNAQQQAGNAQQQAGNEQQQAGNEQHQAGNVQHQAGNAQQQAGNVQHQAGNVQHQAGNVQHQAGNAQQQAGNVQNQPTFQIHNLAGVPIQVTAQQYQQVLQACTNILVCSAELDMLNELVFSLTSTEAGGIKAKTVEEKTSKTEVGRQENSAQLEESKETEKALPKNIIRTAPELEEKLAEILHNFMKEAIKNKMEHDKERKEELKKDIEEKDLNYQIRQDSIKSDFIDHARELLDNLDEDLKKKMINKGQFLVLMTDTVRRVAGENPGIDSVVVDKIWFDLSSIVRGTG